MPPERLTLVLVGLLAYLAVIQLIGGPSLALEALKFLQQHSAEAASFVLLGMFLKFLLDVLRP